jgi:hypothetical protein
MTPATRGHTRAPEPPLSGCAGDAVRIDWIDGSESMPPARITLENDMIAAGGDAVAISGARLWQGTHLRVISGTAPVDLDLDGAAGDRPRGSGGAPATDIDWNICPAGASPPQGPRRPRPPAHFRSGGLALIKRGRHISGGRMEPLAGLPPGQ